MLPCRQGIGFSPEIETTRKLKPLEQVTSRQGIGFSPEIETHKAVMLWDLPLRRQGIGFSPEIETSMPYFRCSKVDASPGDWLLA